MEPQSPLNTEPKNPPVTPPSPAPSIPFNTTPKVVAPSQPFSSVLPERPIPAPHMPPRTFPEPIQLGEQGTPIKITTKVTPVSEPRPTILPQTPSTPPIVRNSSPASPLTTPKVPEPVAAQKIPLQSTTPAPVVSSSIVPRLRTLKTDVEQSIKSGSSTIVSVVAQAQKARVNATQDKAQLSASMPSTQKKPLTASKIILIGFLITLLAWGIEAIVYFQFFDIPTVAPVTKSPTAIPPIISVEQEKKIDGTGKSASNIFQIVAQEAGTNKLQLNSIEKITITQQNATGATPIGTTAFLTLSSPHVPPALARTLDENYILGLHTYDGVQPFIIFKVTSYDQAFANMLSWEKYLPLDAGSLFLAGQTSTGTTSAPTAVAEWSDAVIQNKDARVYKSPQGKTLLIYSFVDQKTLIFANNEGTFGELLRRLSIPHVTQ